MGTYPCAARTARAVFSLASVPLSHHRAKQVEHPPAMAEPHTALGRGQSLGDVPTASGWLHTATINIASSTDIYTDGSDKTVANAVPRGGLRSGGGPDRVLATGQRPHDGLAPQGASSRKSVARSLRRDVRRLAAASRTGAAGAASQLEAARVA